VQAPPRRSAIFFQVRPKPSALEARADRLSGGPAGGHAAMRECVPQHIFRPGQPELPVPRKKCAVRPVSPNRGVIRGFNQNNAEKSNTFNMIGGRGGLVMTARPGRFNCKSDAGVYYSGFFA
jgi:hypothetical protein